MSYVPDMSAAWLQDPSLANPDFDEQNDFQSAERGSPYVPQEYVRGKRFPLRKASAEQKAAYQQAFEELKIPSSYIPALAQATMQQEGMATKRKFVPRDQHVETLSLDELKKFYVDKDPKKAKKTTKKRAYKKARRGSYGRGGAGTNIVYPNVVGRGAYGLSGGLSWGNEGDYFRGSLGGYYNDQPAGTVVGGRGAYNVKSNSLLMIPEGQGPPSIINVAGQTVIRHREYLGDMTCPTGAPSPFNIFFQQVINPGNPTMFPWLSQITPNWQEWEALGMIFEMKTMSSDYTANTSLGTVFAATDYNTLAAAPVNKQQLENMEFSQSCKSSCSILMPIECNPRLNVAQHLYIAPNLDYNGGDPQLYNLGQVFMGSQGLPNSGGVVGTIAELWVSYEIVLYKPKIPNAVDAVEALPLGLFVCSGVTNAHSIGTLGNQRVVPPQSLVPGSGLPKYSLLPEVIAITAAAVGDRFTIIIRYGFDSASSTATYGPPTLTLPAGLTLTSAAQSTSPSGTTTGRGPTFVDAAITSASTLVDGMVNCTDILCTGAAASGTHLITVGAAALPNTCVNPNCTVMIIQQVFSL